MADPSTTLTPRQLADLIGAQFIPSGLGKELSRIGQLATLEQAGPEDVSFLANPKYRHLLEKTRAGIVIMAEVIPDAPFAILLTPEPYLAMTRALALFDKPLLPPTGIHSSAVIGSDCWIDEDVRIAPNVSIGNGVRIAKGSALYPGVVLGDGVRIGFACILYPNVSIYHGVAIGNRVIIHANSVIGSDGFGFAREGAHYVKIPQIGSVIIHDDVEIGAGCTIDRGSLGTTVIGSRSKLDNLIQIAHNVQIGEDTVIVAQTGVSGSTRIGNRVTVAGQVGIAGHLEIADDCTITARCGVMKSVKPGTVLSGFPPAPHKEWLKTQGILSKAQEMYQSIRDLTRRIEELERLNNERGNS